MLEYSQDSIKIAVKKFFAMVKKNNNTKDALRIVFNYGVLILKADKKNKIKMSEEVHDTIIKYLQNLEKRIHLKEML